MTQECASNVENEACAACLEKKSIQVSRRSFFASFLGASMGIIATVVGLPMFRYILYPIQSVSRAGKWTEIGDTKEFNGIDAPITKTISLTQRDGWRDVVSRQSVFVSRSASGELQVLSPICPHLGCSVSWHANQNKFICPCHGGQFSADGAHISGPPPRGLDKLDVQVKDGKLEVQFQYFRSNVPNRELLS